MGLCWLLTSPPTFVRMRVSPRAFFIGKVMKLKGTQSVRVDFTEAGTIVLEQLCDITNEFVYIYLTLEQFSSVESWVFKNQEEIEYKWNSGVEDDSKA